MNPVVPSMAGCIGTLLTLLTALSAQPQPSVLILSSHLPGKRLGLKSLPGLTKSAWQPPYPLKSCGAWSAGALHRADERLGAHIAIHSTNNLARYACTVTDAIRTDAISGALSKNSTFGSQFVVNANFGTYGRGPYWGYNSVWNRGALESGRDFIQSIIVTPSDFPSGTILTWRWPNLPAANNVYSFPELAYGVIDAGGLNLTPQITPATRQIGSFRTLMATHDLTISGEKNQYDILYDGYLTAQPFTTKLFEYSFLIHTPDYLAHYVRHLSSNYTCNFSHITWTLGVVNSTPPHLLFMPSAAQDLLSRTIDLKAGFDCAMAKDITTNNEYISGIELGAEPRMGHGRIVLNAYKVVWQ
jgi:hypothetical protein